MEGFYAPLAIVLSAVALLFSVLGHLFRNKEQNAGRRLAWTNQVISWSSGVMDEMETVLHIFKQLKYGTSFEDITHDVAVSQSNISALLDYGALLIGDAMDYGLGRKPSGREKQEALEAVQAVYGRLCLVADSGGSMDADENIRYIARCIRLFVDAIRSRMALAGVDGSLPFQVREH